MEKENHATEERKQLILNLKRCVIEECNALKVTPAEIGDDEPIIAGPGALQLDSLDAVELVGMIERNFGIKLDNAGDARKVLKSFNVLADFIETGAKREKIAAFIAKFP